MALSRRGALDISNGPLQDANRTFRSALSAISPRSLHVGFVSPKSVVRTHRALVFPVSWRSASLDWVLCEFGLLVDEWSWIELKEDIRTRARFGRDGSQV